MIYRFTFNYNGNLIYEEFTIDKLANDKFQWLVNNRIPFKIITIRKRTLNDKVE